ncbi:MAG: helix-turn-helix domain-containing protein [Bacteroidota bacterium]
MSVKWVFGGYLLSLLSMISYTVAGFMMIGKSKSEKRADNLRWNWTRYFNIGIGTLLILFISQSFFFDSFTYQGIIIGSAIVLYFLTLVALKQVKLFMYEPRRKNKHHQIEELGKRIEVYLKKEEIYTNPLMSVTLLAKQLTAPPYLVSLAVNAYFEKSFPEIINALRIQKAEELLTDPDKSHFTIEAIAYESGFSALSAFYTAFKKAHHKTPKTYRKQSLKLRTKEVSPENN